MGQARAKRRLRQPCARLRALALLGSLASVALGCERAAESPRPPEGAGGDPALHLQGRLGQAKLDGLAAELARGAAPEPERTLLAADFEDGALAPLAPFAGLARRRPAAPSFARVVGGEPAFAGGKSAQLRGGVPHGVSLRTPPIPVGPEERYRLRYRVALQGARPGPEVESGRASILLYRLPAADAGRAAEVLADPEREREARLPAPAEFAPSIRPATQPWILEEIVFSTGPRATHMVLSFDLSRPRDDRAPHFAVGTARFDDVEITARREALARRQPAIDRGAGDPSPLEIVPVLGHSAHADASEARYAIAAPAPSTISWTVSVPERASLRLGYGLLPGARIPGGPATRFSVDLTDADGRVHPVFEGQLRPEEAAEWLDADLDLAAFSGQRATLALRTEGRPASGDARADLLRLPEAGAVWSYPVLHASGRSSRLFVLVGVDTLPALRTSTYGYRRPTTPKLSAIARQGVLFTRALSPSPWTLPAFASMLTGLTPGRHGAGEVVYGERDWYRSLAGDFLTLAERLQEADFETRAWVNSPYFAPWFGLHQGFTAYVDYGTRAQDAAADPGVNDLLAYLERPSGIDRFVFLHLLDPHGPYRSSDDFRRRFLSRDYRGPLEAPLDRERFAEISNRGVSPAAAERGRIQEFHDAAVAYADSQLGRVFEVLQRRAAHDEVVLIVSADHGEEFWEHGRYEHGHSMVDEVLRVPLVAYAPGVARGPREVAEPVSTRDVVPTLLELAGLPLGEPMAARSLVSLMRGGPAGQGGRILFAENTLYGVQRLAAERAGAKYVYNQQSNGRPGPRSPKPASRHELYLIDEDPGEERNRFPELLDRARPLHDALAERFVDSLGGSYVVYLDGGDDAGADHRLSGELVLPPGALWHPFSRDFVWPRSDGSDAPLRIRHGAAGGRARIEFSVEAPRALLAFPLREGSGPVTLSLSLDGEPLAPERVEVGRDRGPPAQLPVELGDEDLWLPPRSLLDRASGEVRVRVGRVIETRPLAGGSVDPDLRRQLEELGYIAD